MRVTGPPAYDDLARAWRDLRAMPGLTLREVACVGAARTLLLVEVRVAIGAPTVALAAGVHGDEPAASSALLSIVRDGLLDRRYNYRIWPCTNPSGYALGTRANADGADINRSFDRGGRTPEARAILTADRHRAFALSIDLHEDFEADGFYCYEPVVDGTAPYGERLTRAMDDAGFPVQDLTDAFDLGYDATSYHVRALERGRVLPDTAAEMAHFTHWAYSLAMLHRGTRRSLTLETPVRRPWEERLAMHRVAVVSALAHVGDA